jgi:hypothetical protein
MAYMDDNEPITCTGCGPVARIQCPHVPHLSEPAGRRLAATVRRESVIRAEVGQLDDEWEQMQARRERRSRMTGTVERLIPSRPTAW